MARAFAVLLVAALAFVLLVASGSARAEGVVNGVSNGTVYQLGSDADGLGKYSSVDAAAAKWKSIATTGRCWQTSTFSIRTVSASQWIASMVGNYGPCPSGPYSTGAVERAIYAVTGVICPANATLGTNGQSCTCDASYLVSADRNSCKPDCTPNTVVSSGFYSIGANPAANPRLLACSGICETIFDGEAPAGSSLEAGAKVWYAKGSYIRTGGSCPAALQGTTEPVVNAAIPPDTCGPNQAKGTVNEKSVCIDQAGDNAGKPTEAAKDQAKSKTSEETTVTTNSDGSTTTKKTTTTTNPDGSTSTTIESSTKRPDGSVTTTRETTATPGTGSKGEGDSGDDDGEQSECQKNPSGAGCGGAAASIGNLYSGKGNTLSDVLNARTAQMQQSPVGAAVAGFFSVTTSVGTCPTFQASLAYLNTTLTMDQFCTPFATTALAVLKVCVLVVFSFFAFRVAVE